MWSEKGAARKGLGDPAILRPSCCGFKARETKVDKSMMKILFLCSCMRAKRAYYIVVSYWNLNFPAFLKVCLHFESTADNVRWPAQLNKSKYWKKNFARFARKTYLVDFEFSRLFKFVYILNQQLTIYIDRLSKQYNKSFAHINCKRRLIWVIFTDLY